MRIGFVYNDELNTVGYERNIDVKETIGYMIDLVCEVFGRNQDDFVFMLNSFTVAHRHWVLEEMGFTNEDRKRLKIYCVRKTSPLLLYPPRIYIE